MKIENKTTMGTLVKMKEYVLAYSPVHEDELQPNRDEAMRLEIEMLLKLYGKNIAASLDFNKIENGGIALYSAGFGLADELHIAYAEACKAEFITCDDDLIRKCRRNNIIIWYGTPVDFGRKEGLL